MYECCEMPRLKKKYSDVLHVLHMYMPYMQLVRDLASEVSRIFRLELLLSRHHLANDIDLRLRTRADAMTKSQNSHSNQRDPKSLNSARAMLLPKVPVPCLRLRCCRRGGGWRQGSDWSGETRHAHQPTGSQKQLEHFQVKVH